MMVAWLAGSKDEIPWLVPSGTLTASTYALDGGTSNVDLGTGALQDASFDIADVNNAALAALRACLQALADAIASTNLAVINGAQGDPAAATSRVQASVAALKRFHEAFVVLQPPASDEADDEADED